MDLTKSQYLEYVQSLKHPNIQIINQRVEESISESDIYNYLGYGFDIREDVITYSELSEYSSIDEVLDKNKSFKIILIEQQENYGHWTLLMRYGNTIEFFNSYGTKPSYEIDQIGQSKNEELGQDEKYLNRLLTLALGKYNVIYNKKRFQKLAPKINTCGRHCICRLIMLMEFNMDLKTFIKYMEDLKKYYKNYKLSYDQIVALIII
jgi:hypothetical protein